jgi:asparagine synthase (glutamine-hydrolysing)
LAYGPHDTACASVDDNFALGRNLFKLLAEDAEDRQPLINQKTGLSAVADVRLDNRAEIIARLGPSSTDMDRQSDAAVLMAGYDRFGEDVLDLILGDYAFAIWDSRKQSLLLARDPLGQRPLFYHRCRDFLAFSSMPKGLHALPGVKREYSRDGLVAFTGLLPLNGPASFYEGISRVEPGHVVTITATGSTTRRYWHPERAQVPVAGSFEEYRDAFRAELNRAVRARLRDAGGVVASHLSSGWDSNAVTATAARIGKAEGFDVLALTSVPRPGSRTESPFNLNPDEGDIARATAALYGNVRHVLVHGTGASPVAPLDRYVDIYDRPLLTLCNFVWLSAIRDAAKAGGARVLLTGEMGNWSISSSPASLLADLIRERRWGSWWREASAMVRNKRARYRGILASSFAPWLPNRVWRLFRPFSSRPETAVYTAVHPGLAEQVERMREERGIGLARRPKDNLRDTLDALTFYDFGEYRKGALAGWGIDERDPTADRRLIEFCLSLPIEMLLKDGVRRPLARAALLDRLPPAVLDEKRKGYQAADWYEGMTRDLPAISALIDDIASDHSAASLLDIEALRQMVENWPESGWNDARVMARYRTALLVALSAGHFIRHTKR